MNITYTAGTSFASPVAAGKIAEVIGRLSGSNPLVAKSLLINSANHPDDKADKYFGHGFSADTVEDMLYCDENSVSTLYQHKIQPGK
ncbi:MAG: S8 family serine peptidase [Acidaminobacteraceae bacterium]